MTYNPFSQNPGVTNSGYLGNAMPRGGGGGFRGIAGGGMGPGFHGSTIHAGVGTAAPGARAPMTGAYGGGNMHPFFQGGGGGAGGGAGVGGPQLPYQPNAPQTQNLINPLAETGQGLLDPNSAYSDRLRQEMVGGIGQQTEAMQRAAALNASRAGFGSGAGAEMLETQGDIGRTGLEAQGQAAADMTLAAPKLGAQVMAPALSAQLGLQGQNMQAYMGQQNLQAQQESDQLRADIEAARLAQENFWREMQFMGMGF